MTIRVRETPRSYPSGGFFASGGLDSGQTSYYVGGMSASLGSLVNYWLMVFAGSGIGLVILVAVLLSIFRVPIPKKRPGEPSWFPDEKKYPGQK